MNKQQLEALVKDTGLVVLDLQDLPSGGQRASFAFVGTDVEVQKLSTALKKVRQDFPRTQTQWTVDPILTRQAQELALKRSDELCAEAGPPFPIAAWDMYQPSDPVGWAALHLMVPILASRGWDVSVGDADAAGWVRVVIVQPPSKPGDPEAVITLVEQ